MFQRATLFYFFLHLASLFMLVFIFVVVVCPVVEMLPKEQARLLKWKISTVTPNVVKNAVARSHFVHTKSRLSQSAFVVIFFLNKIITLTIEYLIESHDWLGCWGHHMKSPCFKTLQEHQKVKT